MNELHLHWNLNKVMKNKYKHILIVQMGFKKQVCYYVNIY